MPLQFRKGTESERQSGTFVPLSGEPIYTTDTKKLYIGDGATAGGVDIATTLSFSDVQDIDLTSENISTISTVELTSNVVTIDTGLAHGYISGQSVVVAAVTTTSINGTYEIIDVPTSTSFTYALTLADIANTVDTGTVTPVIANGSALIWDSSSSAWIDGVPSVSVSELSDVSITGLSDGQSLIYDNATSSWTNSTPATDLASLTDVSLSSVADGEILVYDLATTSWQNATLSVSGLGTRATASATTASIADGASANISITGYKSYMLMSIQADAACWVSVYTSTAARTADASRPSYQDPLPGSGVIAEVIFAASGTQMITPSLLGFNDEATPTTDIYLKVENQSGASAAITVTLKLLQLEA